MSASPLQKAVVNGMPRSRAEAAAMAGDTPELHIKILGRLEYRCAWQRMIDHNRWRDNRCADEIWVLQHDPVYTLGLAGKAEHIIAPGALPVVRSDRGGQVSYHGPGQLIIYPLLDLQRYRLRVRRYVEVLEQVVMDFLAEQGVQAGRRAGAPGVYVAGAKLAALGLRVRQQRSYHGLALNVDVDLSPYQGIDPCGHPRQAVTRLVDLGVNLSCAQVAPLLCGHLIRHLNGLSRARRRIVCPPAWQGMPGFGRVA